MSGLTTHVLDAVWGGGAVGIGLAVRREEDGAFATVATGRSDGNGRAVLLAPDALVPGLYEIVFSTLAFYRAQGHRPFFDDVVVRFRVSEAGGACHIPVVVAPGAYSAYRGGSPPTGPAALPLELAG